LDYNFGVTPLEEEALFLTLKDYVVTNTEFDKFAGLDPEAKAKAIKTREVSEKKKVDKLKEANRKSKENQMKAEENKKKRQLEKQQEKEKEKRRVSKDDTVVPELATSKAGMNIRSFGFSLTHERLVQGMTPSAKTVIPAAGINKCVLNIGLRNLDMKSKAFKDVEAFLAMVIHSHPYFNLLHCKTQLWY